MKQKAKVYMLPTNDKSSILKDVFTMNGHSHVELIAFSKEVIGEETMPNYLTFEYQHLYITTDEEIKEGDNYLIELFNIEGKSTGLHLEQCNTIEKEWINNSSVTLTRHIKNCKKIIASTDSKCTLPVTEDDLNPETGGIDIRVLPQPSQQFIKDYCKAGGIDEVLVEYEEDYEDHPEIEGSLISEKWSWLKINSDNTINIHSIKNSWNRAEMIHALTYGHNRAKSGISHAQTLIDFKEDHL